MKKSVLGAAIAVTVSTMVLLASCSPGEEVYYRFHLIDQHVWNRDSAVVFKVDSPAVNPSTRYAVSLEITYTNSYPYQDLWVRIDPDFGLAATKSDTVSIRLSDAHGKWLGSGVGGENQLSVPYLDNVRLDTAGRYALSVRHLMSDKYLTGIAKIGVRIVPEEAKANVSPWWPF